MAGHRQDTLYKHRLTTLVLFVFSAHSGLSEHRTKGTVIIQVVKGHVKVTADGTPHDLGSGGVLVMAAGVPHQLIALEESEMLLTVHLETG